MKVEEREHWIRRTLHHMERGMYDYAILSDQDNEDNYVQFFGYGPGRSTRFEVTSRRYPHQVLPPLRKSQVKALQALGLDPRATPNHAVDLLYPNPGTMIRLCKRAFVILGSASDFEMDIKVGLRQGHPRLQR